MGPCPDKSNKNSFSVNTITTILYAQGEALPYLKVVENVRRIDHLFGHFQIPLGPFLCPNRSY